MTFDNLCQQIFGKIRKIKIDVPQTITRYKNTIKTITVFCYNSEANISRNDYII